MNKDEKFQRGISHFNAGEFFEAHEVWEEIWLEEVEPEKTFLQGIIQIAAAFHHYCRENTDGTENSARCWHRQTVALPCKSSRSCYRGVAHRGEAVGDETLAKVKIQIGQRFRDCASVKPIENFVARNLRIDDELALHRFVLFSASLAARVGIGARRVPHNINRKSFTFSEFPAVFTKYKVQTGRGCVLWHHRETG